MKKVFSSNSTTAHYWANRVQAEGRSSGISFDNGKLYSYKTVIAEFIGDTNNVIISTHSYSNSTSKHQNYARQSLHSNHNKIYIDCPLWGNRSLIFSQNNFDNEIVIYNHNVASKAILRASRARTLADNYLAIANNIYANLEKYAALLGLIYERPDFTLTQEQAINVAKEQAIKDKAKKAQKIIDQAEDLIKWRNGENIYNNFEFTALRIKGDIIQTSRGANIPLDHAIKAYPLLKKLHDKNADIDLKIHSIKFGHYEMKEFKNDNLIVGCHMIPYSEVSNIAIQLGL